jgi:hypothetical protein
MERTSTTTWLIAALALVVGFLAALLILGGNDDKNASATVSQTSSATTQAGVSPGTTPATSTTSTPSTTTASAPGAAPQAPAASIQACVDLWNQAANRPNQTFLVNVMSQQPVRIHVGTTSDVPPQCLVTVVANDGKAYVFPEGGGSTFPYATQPGGTDASSLPAAQKISNALEERDGTMKSR